MPDTTMAPAPETTQTPPAEAQVQTPPAEPVQPATPVEPVAKTETPQVPSDVAEYIARLEEQTARAQEVEDRQVLQSSVAQYASKLEREQGLTPEQARFIAEREGQQAFKAYQTEKQLRGRFNAALEIGQKYGIDPRKIVDLPSAQAMTEMALSLSAPNKQSAEIASLKAQLAELQKKLAPPQKFDGGAKSAPGSTTAGPVTREQLANMTPAEYAEWRKTGLKSR